MTSPQNGNGFRIFFYIPSTKWEHLGDWPYIFSRCLGYSNLSLKLIVSKIISALVIEHKH